MNTLFVCLAWIATFVAIVRIVTTPVEKWSHGRMSKTAWIIAAIWFAPHVGSVVLPLGAAAAFWYSNYISERTQVDPHDVPYAEGATDELDRGKGS